MKLLEMKDRAAWRVWLAANHQSENEAWLVYFKGKTSRVCIDYEASVEEALCYGWIDSIIKKLDESRYARKFTPRKDDSKWSVVNKRRATKLMDDGLMTEHGLKKIEAAKQSGWWDKPVKKPDMSFTMSAEFAQALRTNKKAQETYDNLSWTCQKQYLGWIQTAKLAETKERRIKESIRMLEAGKKLGLK